MIADELRAIVLYKKLQYKAKKMLFFCLSCHGRFLVLGRNDSFTILKACCQVLQKQRDILPASIDGQTICYSHCPGKLLFSFPLLLSEARYVKVYSSVFGTEEWS